MRGEAYNVGLSANKDIQAKRADTKGLNILGCVKRVGDGYSSHIYNCTACLSTINGRLKDHYSGIEVFLFELNTTRFAEDPDKLEKASAMWDYIITRSPYAKLFKSKSSRLSIKRGLVMLNAKDYPATEVASAMCCLRAAWEYPIIRDSWYALTKAGVNENLALLLAHSVKGTIGSSKFGSGYLSHVGLYCSNITLSGAAEFVKGRLVGGYSKLPYCERGTYNGMVDVGNTEDLTENFLRACRIIFTEALKELANAGDVGNPTAHLNPFGYTIQDLLDREVGVKLPNYMPLETLVGIFVRVEGKILKELGVKKV